jgi:hypothetical protein
MTLISQAITSLKGGISQQPPQLRFPDQVTAQENGFSDEVLGLLKRPPSVFTSRLNIPNIDTAKIHVINRDETEKYIMTLTPPSDYVIPEPNPGVGVPQSITYEWLTPGVYTVVLPEWAQTFEYWVLGGGGEGGLCTKRERGFNSDGYSYSNQTPGESGGLSKIDIGIELTVQATGGEGGKNAVQAKGGIPNGLPGNYKYDSFWTAPDKPIITIWGVTTTTSWGSTTTTYPRGLGGGTYTANKQRHSGGGTGGYNVGVTTLERGSRTITITVGKGGNKDIPVKYLGKPGGDGAVRLKVSGVVYNDDPVEVPPPPDIINVIGLDGSKYDVTITPESASYFSDIIGSPRNTIKAVTIADYTIILNKEKVVKMTTKKTATRNPDALIYCKNTAYGKKHEIFIDGVPKASYTVPNGSDPSHSTSATTTNVITQLINGLSTSNVSFLAGTDWILITGVSGSPLTDSTVVTTGDGFGNTNMKCILGEVKSVNDLPATAPNGYRVRVKGYNTDQKDDFWLKYDGTKTNWVEIAAPGVEVEFDPTTMPQSLVREADGTFTLKPIEWYERLTGDDETNSKPSFVGKTINDLFFFRNRLGMLCDENIVLSKSAEFFQFWFDSATGIVDEDPIDVAVSADVKRGASVNLLLEAVPMETDLLVFAKEAQFLLRGDGVLSAKNNRVDFISASAFDGSCSPISISNGIYFISRRAQYSSVYKYSSVIESPELKKAEDVTAHVPNYLPNGLYRMSGSVSEDIVTFLTDGDRSKVFVFKFREVNSQFVQQAWSEWLFPTSWKIHLADFIDDKLMLIVTTGEGTELHYMRMVGNTVDFPLIEQKRYFVDRKVTYEVPTENFDVATGKTLFRLSDIYGYATTREWSGGDYVVITPDGLYRRVPEEDRIGTDGGLFYLYGDFSNSTVLVGRVFKLRVEMSRLYIKTQNRDGGVVPYTEGNLMLRYMWLDTAECGPFDIIVYPDGVPNEYNREFSYRYSPRVLGTQSATLGNLTLGSDQFRFPIHGKNTTTSIIIESDEPTSFGITGGGWEGLYTSRARRL